MGSAPSRPRSSQCLHSLEEGGRAEPHHRHDGCYCCDACCDFCCQMCVSVFSRLCSGDCGYTFCTLCLQLLDNCVSFFSGGRQREMSVV